MEDFRKQKRIPFTEAVQYRLSPWQEPKGCVSRDFSAGGIRLQVEDFIALNSDLFLDIGLPTRNTVQVTGRVAWIQRIPHSEAYQLGVEFKTLSVRPAFEDPVLS